MKNILARELIGIRAEIAVSKNRSLAGISGIIVDETKNTLTLETKNGRKKLIKNQSTLLLYIDGKKIMVDGKLLVARPEDRIKIREQK